MIKKYIFITISSMILIFSSNIFADEIILAADNWCPISCEPDTKYPGILIEIADSIFSKSNHKITYIQLPWKRAITETREGQINGIIGAFYGDAPDFIFPKKEQTILTNAFYVCQESVWNFDGIESLEKICLGYINGYNYGKFLKDYLENTSTENVLMICGESNLTERLMTLLTAKRVDVVVETNLVFQYQSKRIGNSEKFRFAGNASQPMKAFIAFSPNNANSKKYAKILSNGMIDIYQNGVYDKILEKYNVVLPK